MHCFTIHKLKMITKKIIAQKGSGGARHASKKAPIFVGGGVAHGPKGETQHKIRKLKVKLVKRYMRQQKISLYIANEIKKII